ncbi:GntR family transcriptional regulator [Pseudorhodobacter sp. E13]|uniref:GntR family transcriptional regulator n=1 Tax=Pseudorhodobacter sp. E13 TaxID=2487931 RepID=UPI000F8D0ECC|nr:GntR family transcriptional regulator [Pseudorhodobacter sp. E13]RUS63532.1 GntR family transcriptional regulator [Pseudorhodobacter sp. E13]
MPLPAAFHLDLAPDRNAQQQASGALRNAILTGQLPPGTRLSEQEIADSIGLSRQPVREAFLRLAGEGLLEIRPQRGTFVSKITVEEVLAVRFVREAVEADLIRIACTQPDPAAIAQLRALLDLQAKAASPAAFMPLDEAFHRQIAELAGRARAWDHLQKLKSQMDRVRFLQLQEFSIPTLIAQHSAMVDAIEARAPDRAEAEIRKHLRLIEADLAQIEAEYPDYFTQSPNHDTAKGRAE